MTPGDPPRFAPPSKRATPSCAELRVEKRGRLMVLASDSRVKYKYIVLFVFGVCAIGVGISIALREIGLEVPAIIVAAALLVLVAVICLVVPVFALRSINRASRSEPVLTFDPSTNELVIGETHQTLARDAVISIDTVKIDWPSDGEGPTIDHYVVLRVGNASSSVGDHLIHIGMVSSRRSIAAFAAAAGLKHRDYSVSAQSRRA